ncbi:MAG: amino acid ABC transporter substrate-binding protein [Chitinophagales bacterium]|nr:amino acid ABC transporter substrate-binding protein [Chitinophagales bacterium]
MISARNHQRQLNGSKLILLLICGFLIFPACSIFQKTAKSPDVVIPSGTKDPVDNSEITETEPKVDTVKEKTDTKIDSRRFRVALIMPFQTDNMFKSYSVDDDNEPKDEEYILDQIPKDVEMTLDFYQGLLMGFYRMEKKGLDLDLYVYDSKKSTFETDRILEKAEFKSMDLIIGPMYNKIASKVAAFAKENKIMHVLPFSPADNLTSENPYHIKVNPTIDVHCRNLYEYIVDEYPGENIVIVYRDNSAEITLSNKFHELSMYTNDEMLPPKMVMYDKYEFDLDDYLIKDSKNIVIVASLNEAFAQKITRQLHLKSREFDITAFGMPTWLDAPSLNLDYFESLNFHTSKEIWIEDNKNVESFKSDYIEEMYADPSEAAYLGFDIAYYFGYLMNLKGKNFHKHVGDEIFEGLSTNFNFQPKLSKENSVEYLENSYVRVLKFENYELKPVN